jgi:hypothetical protein
MPAERGYVIRSGSSATATTPVALVAATAKTVLSYLAAAADTPCVVEIGISFDGTSGTPAVVELGEVSTLGTVTSFTPHQEYGPVKATAGTAGYNASAEPTYQSVRRPWYVPVNNGLWSIQFPLAREPSVVAGRGFALRVTAPAIVNCLPYMIIGE